MAVEFPLSTLSEMRKQYVIGICDGMSKKAAAEKAGYKAGQVHFLNSDPKIALAVQERVRYLLCTHDAPLARQVLLEILQDKKAPYNSRIDCAKALLNRGGFVEPKAMAITVEGVSKPASEMSGAELEKEIERMQLEMEQRSGRATLIEGSYEPISPITQEQPFDFLT